MRNVKHQRLNFLVDIQNSNVDKKSKESERKVRLANYVDVYYNDILTDDLEYMNSTASESDIQKCQLFGGEVIITKDSESPDDIGIAAYVDANPDNLVCGYHLTILKPKPKQTDGKFLFYCFNSQKTKDQLAVAANGVTRYGLSQNAIKNLSLPTFDLPTQRAIARYLEERTTRIDALITAKERLLDLLAERRAALITRAVTRGLDENVELKPSGVDWLGDIPVGWEVKRLRFLVATNPSKGEITLSDDTEVSFFAMEDIGDDGSLNHGTTRMITDVSSGYTYFKEGDLSVAKITPCFENGKGAIMTNLIEGIGFGTTELHILRPNEKILIEYLSLIVNSTAFRKIGESTMYGAGGQKRISDQFIKDFKIGVPKVSKQEEILTLLRDKLKKMFDLQFNTDISISHLKEYRAALITAAVNGEIKLSTDG